jgi:hypothetical protein
MEEGEEEEENWENSLFWGTLIGHCCFWELWALGTRKPQGFLEIGSQRGCS